jgi:hypothetical protein
MSITLSALQKQRTDTAANWTAANPTLLAGELGFESDTGKAKLGTGSTAWTSLGYLGVIPSSGVYPLSQLLMPSGTVSAPSISFNGDTDLGIYRSGTDQLSFTTAGTERLRITSTGTINIVGAGTAGSTQAISFNGSAPVNSLVIDSSGRLLVGTSVSASTALGFTPNLQIANSGAGAAVSIGRYSANASQPQFAFQKSRGAVGVQTVVNSGDTLGQIVFEGSDGAAFKSAASISAVVDGTPGTDDMPGRLVFSTTADSVASPTERLRITSAGLVGVGTSSPRSALDVAATGAVNWGFGADSLKGAVTIGAQGTVTSSLVVNTPGFSSGFPAGFGVDGTYSNPGGIGTAVINLKALGVSSGGGYNSHFSFQITNGATLSEGMRLTPTGLGIGTTSPGENLSIAGGANLYATLASTGGIKTALAAADANGFGWVGTTTNHAFAVFTNNTERARIDSSGRLLVGTSSAVTGASASISKLNVIGNSSNFAGNAAVVIGRGAAASTLSAGNDVGGIFFTDNGSNEFAAIACQADAATGAADAPGRLVFSTTADGAASPTERMRIDSNGFARYAGAIGRGAPVTKTGAFTVGIAENWLICNGTASITVTLPTASVWTGREIMLKTIAAFTVISASSNVVPLTTATAGTAILAATAGKYATLVSDGTNWIVMQAN